MIPIPRMEGTGIQLQRSMTNEVFMSYLIAIAVSFSSGFVAGILFARHNASKVDNAINAAQTIASNVENINKKS